MPDPPHVRISDQERERGAREIREHFAAGRLTEDELSERVQAVYEARTAGELEALRADLPPLPATRAAERAELARRRGHLRRRLLQESGGALVPFFICVVIWLATGAEGSFWPIWVALPAVLLLVRNGWNLYGPAPELERVEQELARRQRRDERDAQRAHRHHR
jgi:hypothetical protein